MQYGQYGARKVGFPSLGTVAMVGPSDGSRRALGRFEDCLERHHEEARYHEGVIEQTGTYEEVGD